MAAARVSTDEQPLALQEDALKKAGCERLFTDTVSGAKTERPGLAEAPDFARSADTLVVWRLDRLGRSLQHLIETIQDLEQRGIGFKSVQENIDTTGLGRGCTRALVGTSRCRRSEPGQFAGLALLLGAIWALQSPGPLRGSVMTGQNL